MLTLALIVFGACSPQTRECKWEHSGIEVTGPSKAFLVSAMRSSEMGCKRLNGLLSCGTKKTGFLIPVPVEALLSTELVSKLGDMSIDRLWLNKKNGRLFVAIKGRKAVL